MPVEIVSCPACKQRLALQAYVPPETLVVCANVTCGASLRVASRRPAKVDLVPERDTHSADCQPESYA